MVGSRFSCWYEAVPLASWTPVFGGLELVVLSFNEGASKAIEENIEKTFSS